MTNYRLLVTNDDGCHSPLLAPFLNALAESECCAEIRPVLPKREQSWTAQAMTRMKPVKVLPQNFEAHPGFVVEGTPADCVSLGVGNLYPERPDFVFAGINIGHNAGLAYYLNSGTIGAARQGFIFNIRSAAFSVNAPENIYSAWYNQKIDELKSFAAHWKRIATVCAMVAESLVKNSAWRFADLFSVNIPWEASSKTNVVLTSLEPKYYTSLFRQRDLEHYEHVVEAFLENPVPAARADKNFLISDIAALNKEQISLTPLCYNLNPPNSQDIAALKALYETAKL